MASAHVKRRDKPYSLHTTREKANKQTIKEGPKKDTKREERKCSPGVLINMKKKKTMYFLAKSSFEGGAEKKKKKGSHERVLMNHAFLIDLVRYVFSSASLSPVASFFIALAHSSIVLAWTAISCNLVNTTPLPLEKP